MNTAAIMKDWEQYLCKKYAFITFSLHTTSVAMQYKDAEQYNSVVDKTDTSFSRAINCKLQAYAINQSSQSTMALSSAIISRCFCHQRL